MNTKLQIMLMDPLIVMKRQGKKYISDLLTPNSFEGGLTLILKRRISQRVDRLGD